MKPVKCLLFVFAVLACTSVAAQTQLEFNYNKSHTGYNYRFGASYVFKQRFSLGGAIKFLDWYPRTTTGNYQFRSMFQPANFKETLGFSTYFNYYFPKRDRMFNPFVFYDFSFSRATLVKYFERNSEPAYWIDERVNVIEHYFGFGVDVRLYKRLWLTAKVGVGVGQYFKKPDLPDPDCDCANRLYGNSGGPTWMFDLGLKYQLGKSFGKKKE